jgi:hypothetical protein
MDESKADMDVQGAVAGLALKFEVLMREALSGKIQNITWNDSWAAHPIYEEGDPQHVEISRKGEVRTCSFILTYLPSSDVPAKPLGMSAFGVPWNELVFYLASDPEVYNGVRELMEKARSKGVSNG